MIYRKLGRTNLQVGIIGLGGEWFNGRSAEEVKNVIDYGIKNGINYLDIFMPEPEVRTHIGLALKGQREKMLIQGHLCTIFENGQYTRTRDLEKTKQSFENLLDCLQTNYIDVGMIHYVDSHKDYDSVFNTPIIEYAKELKEKGIIKHIGLSSHNPEIALKAIQTGLIDVLMFSINPAYDMEKSDAVIDDLIDFKGIDDQGLMVDPLRQKLYATCENLNIGITVMKALGAGSLLKSETSPFGEALTVSQCCHYTLTRPGVTSVLVGCQNKEEMKAALDYLTCTDFEKNYSHIFSKSGNIKATGNCMYCNHCLPCPSHIDIASVTKFLDLAKIQAQIPETVKEHYKALEKNADDCTSCGQCESNCPFGVQIRENMKAAQIIFK